LKCLFTETYDIGAVYVENVLSKDDFEPEMFSHAVEKASLDTTEDPAKFLHLGYENGAETLA
jgi:hypothetical protein